MTTLMKKPAILLFVLFYIIHFAQAQSPTPFEGKVTDPTGNPLAGAVVTVLDEFVQTTTDHYWGTSRLRHPRATHFAISAPGYYGAKHQSSALPSQADHPTGNR
jgi:hypothetical protein